MKKLLGWIGAAVVVLFIIQLLVPQIDIWGGVITFLQNLPAALSGGWHKMIGR